MKRGVNLMSESRPELVHVLHNLCKGIWASVSLAASCSENMAAVWLLWICKYWIWQGMGLRVPLLNKPSGFIGMLLFLLAFSAREGWEGWHTEGITQPRTQKHTHTYTNRTHVHIWSIYWHKFTAQQGLTSYMIVHIFRHHYSNFINIFGEYLEVRN